MDQSQHKQREGSVATLGDVLYGGQAAPDTEREWARLVQAIAGGDQRALHALFERTSRIVFTLILRIIGNRETAEELTLDVFHDVWRRAAAYDAANGTVVGWIMNQARSRAIDRLRFEQRKKRVDPFPGFADAEETASGPDEAVELEERARLVRNAMSALTAHEREAIETAYFAELTHAEAATQLNQPLGTLKTRLRSGLAKLRQALAEKP